MPTIKAEDKFNRLTAIKFSHKGKDRKHYWLFKCDCGKRKVISTDNVKRNHTKSCGCLAIENAKKQFTKHRMIKTKIYRIWADMKSRCLNKKDTGYKNYGGRGITICDSWLKFENFYADMGDRPVGETLDRINNDKGYSKGNCRWATNEEQHNNKRSNHLITHHNKTQTIAQWARELKLPYKTFWNRLNKKNKVNIC